MQCLPDSTASKAVHEDLLSTGDRLLAAILAIGITTRGRCLTGDRERCPSEVDLPMTIVNADG
jgi:hypothetical protein